MTHGRRGGLLHRRNNSVRDPGLGAHCADASRSARPDVLQADRRHAHPGSQGHRRGRDGAGAQGSQHVARLARREPHAWTGPARVRVATGRNRHARLRARVRDPWHPASQHRGVADLRNDRAAVLVLARLCHGHSGADLLPHRRDRIDPEPRRLPYAHRTRSARPRRQRSTPMKTSTCRERQTVTIHSPRAPVWEYAMDLAKITEYNPRVARVEPGSGEGKRAAGVSYRCHLVGGAHCCTEEDMEIVPMERLVTRMVDDTLGLTARLKDYTVETTLTELDARTTRVTMSHFYSTPTLGSHLLNWLARDKISRNTEATLLMLKAQIESATEDGARQAMDLLRRPAFVSAIAVFFVVAAIFSLAVGAALVAPSSPLAEVLRMKPQAQFAFASLGALGVGAIIMLALATLTSLTALGLWVGTRWGWRLAFYGLVVNAVLDLI